MEASISAVTCLTWASRSCSCVQMQFRTYHTGGSSIGSGSIWSLSHSLPWSWVDVDTNDDDDGDCVDGVSLLDEWNCVLHIEGEVNGDLDDV